MLVLRKEPKPLHVYLFIALNALDIALTIIALSLGAEEMNLLLASFQNPVSLVAVKMILAGTIALGLVIFRRVYLVPFVNAGMTLVVIWNIVAVLTWSHF